MAPPFPRGHDRPGKKMALGVDASAPSGSECRSEPRNLGGPGKTLRVYTFSGGGFNSAMQLGVVHAFLTADYERPDLVTGVSAGAISAVALADILQAGRNGPVAAKHSAQVARFRQVLEAYREGPLQLLMAQLPDGYETNARQATENLQLPIHLVAEREGREQAQRAESGLIRLLNEVLAIDLPVRQAVLLIRIALGMREAREYSRPGLLLYERAIFYWRLVRNIHHLSLPIGRVVLLLLWPWDDPPRPCPARQVLFRKERLKRRWDEALRSLAGAVVIFFLPLFSFVAFVAEKLKARLTGEWRERCKRSLRPLLPERWWNNFFSTRAGEECLRSVLSHYALAEDLGDASALRQLFVDIFDPDYFGILDMLQVGEDALLRKKDASRPLHRSPRTLAAFSRDEAAPITVAVLASDINKSKVRPVPPDTPVVDALMAATAIVPFFRAVGLPEFKENDEHGNDLPPPPGTVFYIDGENVNADPLRPTIKYLQQKIDLETSAVRFYSCVAFPISRELASDRPQYRGLVRVALRAIELQRLQNALLERNFIKLYSEVLRLAFEQEAKNSGLATSPAKAVLDRTAPDGNQKGKHKPLIAADVVSIEADRPLRLNQKIIAAESHEARRAVIDQAVADGCRATLNAWLREEGEPLHATGQYLLSKHPQRQFVSCRELIAAHLERKSDITNLPLRPESGTQKGPGLAEICSSCRFFMERTNSDGNILEQLEGFDLASTSSPIRSPAGPPGPSTPDRLKPQAEPTGPTEPTTKPAPRATVSLLFSGGVFRGVYQIGVANALMALQLRPNVVAGASVGSITAALVAEIFFEDSRYERHRKMYRLTTSFLALDRLILTDRFYNFVRRFTLRGGDSQFSPHDVDLLLRRYDEGPTGLATARARRTVAGLERLLYLSPFELHNLIRAQRLQNYSELYRLIIDHLQELLDRNGASLEILGAEPLVLLLNEHLLRFHEKCRVHRFDIYTKPGGVRNIHLLATVTNLTKGYLRTLGSPYTGDQESPVLHEGLLASSAFPGVFRPRNSWEIFPATADQDQYIDGGVMDNLPFASVVGFLDQASKPRSATNKDPLYLRRPPAPHLIVTGSLEPICHDLGPKRTDQVRKCWVALKRRAAHIRYNQKIHDFVVAERDVHEVWEHTGLKPGDHPDEPLDIKVVAVKPEWLCRTFAFHPMLGFKRRRQAASIAHGCAGTLNKINNLWRESPFIDGKRYLWGMRPNVAQHITDHIVRPKKSGTCWFCSHLVCPFSKEALDDLDEQSAKLREPKLPLPPATRRALESIYEECGKPKTHPVPPGEVYPYACHDKANDNEHVPPSA
jgi:predicted acylesterase/phospholipase RssA